MNSALWSSLDGAVHLIQTALTPVFLLSGIAALLNVFAGRLARASDSLERLTPALAAAVSAGDHAAASRIRLEITMLHRRSLVLDAAVVMGTLGAAATCLAILTLFLLGLANASIAGLLLFFFGLAIVCTLASVAAFGLEMLIGSSSLRTRMRFHARRGARSETEA